MDEITREKANIMLKSFTREVEGLANEQLEDHFIMVIGVAIEYEEDESVASTGVIGRNFKTGCALDLIEKTASGAKKAILKEATVEEEPK